jgi:hypothetical protein
LAAWRLNLAHAVQLIRSAMTPSMIRIAPSKKATSFTSCQARSKHSRSDFVVREAGNVSALTVLQVEACDPPSDGYGQYNSTCREHVRPSPRWFAPTILHDPPALAQRNPRVWPPLTRNPIGRPRHNEVLNTSEVLKDVLAVVGPYVDPVNKVGPGSGLVVSYRSGSWPVCCCVNCPRDAFELLIQRRGRWQRLTAMPGTSSCSS